MTEIYLITSPQLDSASFAPALDAALSTSHVAALQLRLKSADDAQWRAVADITRPLCRKAGIPFLLNDRADLCLALGADGVHLGRDDMPYTAARALLGPQAVIGVSAYDDVDQGLEMAAAGADYVAFGAFFPTTTKNPPARARIETLEWWQRNVTTPCVAIGGIRADNCAALVQAGADFLAVISAVWDHPSGPAAALEEIAQAVKQAKEESA